MAHSVEASVTVAPVSTESFPGEEAQHRRAWRSRGPYRPNLFSLVAAEGFAPWRDLGCLARERKRYSERHQPCRACGCSPKNTQHPRTAELMSARKESEVSHRPAANAVSRTDVLDPPHRCVLRPLDRAVSLAGPFQGASLVHLLLLWSDQL